MTAQAKSAPRWHLLAAVAMASPAASLATSQALAVMANLAAMAGVTLAVKASHRVDLVWAMLLSVRSVMPWNRHKMHCVVWQHKPMAKC